MLLKQHRRSRRSSSTPFFHFTGDDWWGKGGGGRVRNHNQALLSDANVCSLDKQGEAGGMGGPNVVTTE